MPHKKILENANKEIIVNIPLDANIHPKYRKRKDGKPFDDPPLPPPVRYGLKRPFFLISAAVRLGAGIAMIVPISPKRAIRANSEKDHS